MFTLVTQKSKFYRVKRGQTKSSVEKELGFPVYGSFFAGKIIPVFEKKFKVYSAAVGDTYKSIAEKFQSDEQELKTFNGGKPVYPTCKIFVPLK